jgi:hypothetical protein
MACIEAVIGLGSMNFPSFLNLFTERLTTELSILLNWGQAIPWCWKMCSDPRSADMEMVSCLVSCIACWPFLC